MALTPRFAASILVFGFACAFLTHACGGGVGTQGLILGHCISPVGEAWAKASCSGPDPATAAQADTEAAAGLAVPNVSACPDGGMGAILATIREQEHGPNPGYDVYRKAYNGGGATGAYQFIDRTWNGYGGFSSSYLAPPEVQDAKARINVEHALRAGGVELVPAIWYVGHVPAAGEWDSVPAPGAGNRLTVRQYQDQWMDTYRRVTGGCA